MIQTILLNEIYTNIINSIIALLVVLLGFLVVIFLFARKIENTRQRRQFRMRSFYVSFFIFIFLMARIWVEGFTHIVAILGLVSAALVVTNKETIMNFVGSIVINWRGLFTEDDLIQIQQYKGYVKSFGMLYFTLAEVSAVNNAEVTGRLISVPNGLIANNVLINFSRTSHLQEQIFKIVVTQDTDPEYAADKITHLVNAVIFDFYNDQKEYSMDYIKRNHRYLLGKIDLQAKVLIYPKLDKPTGVELVAHYYCFSQDAQKIQQKIWLMLLKRLKDENTIQLSYG